MNHRSNDSHHFLKIARSHLESEPGHVMCVWPVDISKHNVSRGLISACTLQFSLLEPRRCLAEKPGPSSLRRKDQGERSPAVPATPVESSIQRICLLNAATWESPGKTLRRIAQPCHSCIRNNYSSQSFAMRQSVTEIYALFSRPFSDCHARALFQSWRSSANSSSCCA